MDTLVDACLVHPYLLESLLNDLDYPTLCDRVHQLTDGRGLDAWCEENCTPANWLEVQRLVKIIESIMAQKHRSSNNILYFPNERMVA